MSFAEFAAEAPSQTAERALNVIWVFDSTLCMSAVEPAPPILEGCRCAACGGLLTAPQAVCGRP